MIYYCYASNLHRWFWFLRTMDQDDLKLSNQFDNRTEIMENDANNLTWFVSDIWKVLVVDQEKK